MLFYLMFSPYCSLCISPPGKPPIVLAKMVEGRLAKFYEENCLMEQKYLLDNDVTVKQALERCGAVVFDVVHLC